MFSVESDYFYPFWISFLKSQFSLSSNQSLSHSTFFSRPEPVSSKIGLHTLAKEIKEIVRENMAAGGRPPMSAIPVRVWLSQPRETDCCQNAKTACHGFSVVLSVLSRNAWNALVVADNVSHQWFRLLRNVYCSSKYPNSSS